MQPENSNFHAKLIELMQKFQQEALAKFQTTIMMPPPSVFEMGTEYVDGDFSTTLRARMPFIDRYRNPVGFYQGGMMGAAFDNVMGPLSYMAFQGPCVTLELHTRFVRPFTAHDEFMLIQCTLTSISKNILTIRGEAHTKDGKLLALASCTSMRSAPRTT